MHIFSKVLLFSLGLGLIISCKKEEETPPENTVNTGNTGSNSDNTFKIMVLGASRVEGDSPNYESFRYELWKDMVENNKDFDLIGTQVDPTSYAAVMNQTFDPDHQGHAGWTSGQILAGLPAALATAGIPDIVLFSSPGGNDALSGLPYQDALDNINAIIDTLQAYNPNVMVIIEKLAPGHSSIMVPPLSTYFTQIQADVEIIANNQSDATSEVAVVDMATGFQDAYLADQVHYNATGADFIATRYYEILGSILNDLAQ